MKAGDSGLYDARLKRRNLAWADQLAKEMTEGSGVELVNLGALPALLKARGFKAERVQQALRPDPLFRLLRRRYGPPPAPLPDLVRGAAARV
jgi:hypothetical protein